MRRRHETCLDVGESGAGGGGHLEVIDASTPHEHLQMREEAELVRAALLQVPEIYRSVLVLRHYEGLKLREIAEVLDIPDGTVNSRMAEGLAQLTRLLEPQFGKQSSQPVTAPRPAKSQEILAL